VFQRRAVQKLHDDEGAAAFFADVVDRADVGVIQSRGGFGFAAKALESGTVLGEIFRKKFEGNKAAETRVFSLVDNAHASAAELFDDAVVRDGLIEQK
jgi:hypothetical protein